MFDYGIVSLRKATEMFFFFFWECLTSVFQIALAAIIGIAWKIVKRTPFRRSEDVDLKTGLEFFDSLAQYYEHGRESEPVTLKGKIVAKLF